LLFSFDAGGYEMSVLAEVNKCVWRGVYEKDLEKIAKGVTVTTFEMDKNKKILYKHSYNCDDCDGLNQNCPAYYRLNQYKT